jgi:AraC-like DNA-binding protein
MIIRMPPSLPPARRRFGSGPGRGADAEADRRRLCASFFDDPKRLADALTHRITGRLVIEPHHHADLLQLDLIQQCEGVARGAEGQTSISGITLLATPPGVVHGYDLRPAGADAAVWLVKFRVGRDDRAGWERAFPSLMTAAGGIEPVRDGLADFVNRWTPRGVGIHALTRLAAAVSGWPTSALDLEAGGPEMPTAAAAAAGDGPSARVRRAIASEGARLDDPPDLARLAAAAQMSARHFSRRFREDFGCTPHEHLQARRLDAARGLLRDSDRRIAGVAEQLGFSSPAAFSRWFTRLAGQSPRNFRTDPQNF